MFAAGLKAGGRFAYNHGRYGGERRGKMALGALIAAYHEDDQGGLRALFPLAGRTSSNIRRAVLQPSCAFDRRHGRAHPGSAAGGFRAPARHEGITLVPVSDGSEAAPVRGRALILQLADGLAPDVPLSRLAEFAEPAIAIVAG
jgi:hypothetical protein